MIDLAFQGLWFFDDPCESGEKPFGSPRVCVRLLSPPVTSTLKVYVRQGKSHDQGRTRDLTFPQGPFEGVCEF